MLLGGIGLSILDICAALSYVEVGGEANVTAMRVSECKKILYEKKQALLDLILEDIKTNHWYGGGL